jgi:hypothetical protein
MSALPLTETLEDQFRSALKLVKQTQAMREIDRVCINQLRRSADELEAEADARVDEAEAIAQSLREKLGDRAYEIEEER